MKKGEVLFIISLLIPMIPAFLMGRAGHGYYYFYTLLTFYTCFGVLEYLSVKQRSRSISQDLGRLHDDKPVIFWAICITYLAMSIGLVIHWTAM